MRAFCLLLSAFCFLLSAYCFLISAFCLLPFRTSLIQPDYFQIRTAFLTRNEFAFICVRIYVDIRIALGTCSNRHFITLRKNLLPTKRRQYLLATAS